MDSNSSAVPFSMGPELVQSTGWAETADRSSLVPHAVLLMPLRVEKCIIVEAVCESRPGHLSSSTWVVHECNFHVQTKSGIQLMCRYAWFSQARSHINSKSHLSTSYLWPWGCTHTHTHMHTFMDESDYKKCGWRMPNLKMAANKGGFCTWSKYMFCYDLHE